jgi:hypothetical protein
MRVDIGSALIGSRAVPSARLHHADPSSE